MGSRERRERERDETRAKIMNAARELFAREGYDAVSMRRIAEAIEYSPTAIYVHFNDKEDLFRQLCNEDFGKLSEVATRLAKVPDPVERIRQVGHAYIRFALAHPNHYRLMFMTAHPHADLDEEAMCRKGNPDEDGYAFLKAAVSEAIDAGRIREEFADSELLTQTLWAAVHGMASLQIVKGNDPWIEWRPVEKRARAAIEAVIRGVLIDDRCRTRTAGTREKK